jgi:putative drug exporter of the RND superfamily
MRHRHGLLRGLVIVVLAAVWLTVSAVGGQSIGTLSEVTTNDQESFLPRNAESVQAQRALQAFGASDQLPALVLILGRDQVTHAFPPEPTAGDVPPGSVYARTLAAGVRVEGVPLSNFLADKAVPLTLKAKDGNGVLVLLPLDAADLEAENAAGESRVVEVVAALRDQVPTLSPGAEVHVTGPAAFAADLTAAFSGIDGILLLVTLGAVLVILLLVYRAVILPLLVLLSSVAGLSLAGLVVYHLARDGHLVVNGQSQGILFILVVGAGTDYGLLLVSRFREELGRTPSTGTALRAAWRACIGPIVASAGTVTLGLLCLLVADLNSVRSLGPVGAIGIGSAVLAALTFLPALLLLGRWVFWPRIPHVAGTDQARQDGRHADRRPGGWERLAAVLEQRPRRIWVVVVLVLCAGAAGLPTLQASGTRDADVLLGRPDSVVGQEIASERFAAGGTEPILVVAPADSATAIADQAKRVPGIVDAVVGKEVRAGQVIVSVTPADPTDAGDEVAAVRAAVDAVAPGHVLVGGSEALRLDTNDTARSDLGRVIPLVLTMVLVVLTVLLRSVVAALLLTMSTVLSFATTMGVSALMFNHVFDFPGADPTVPLLGFVFLVALGIDYSIFLMSRAREEVLLTGPVEGVGRALTFTGGVITGAGVVLAATFAALAVLPLLFLAQIAFIVAFGVLLDALVVRSLLVPALAMDLDRRTWWPSRLSRPPVDGGAERLSS